MSAKLEDLLPLRIKCSFLEKMPLDPKSTCYESDRAATGLRAH